MSTENQPGEKLRKKAEHILSQKGVIDSTLYSRRLEDLVQELSIHQIELEQQNVLLKKAREETEAVREKMKGEQRAVIAHENITKIKEAVLELAESESKFKAIVASMPDAMCMLDRKYEVVWANDLARQTFGENLISKKCTHAYGTSKEACGDCIVRKTFSDGKVHSREYIHVDMDGEERTFLCRSSAAGYDGNGHVHHVMEIMCDISENKKRERNMKFMEFAVDNITDGVFWITSEGGIRYANKAMLTLTGYTEEEMTSFTVADIDRNMTPEEWPIHWEEFQRKGTMRFETVHVAKDGTEIPVEVIPTYIRLEKGEEYSFSVVRDIRERKAAEKLIRQLSRAVEQSPVCVVITDIHAHIEYVNPKFYEVTGYTYDEVIGENPRILNAGQLPDSYFKKMWETILGGEIWHGEFINRKKSGGVYWESASISPITDENGRITNFVAIKEDITEQKQMIRELEEAKEKAESATRAKSNFLATMSHEIRTPMNSILGMSHLALESGLNEIQYNYVANINSSADALLSIINDILDLSKIEAGKLTLSEKEFQFCSVIEKIFNVMKFSAHEKGLDLICEFTHEIPLLLFGDVTRVSQVIINLLSNAVKYTSSGEIAVTSEVVDEKDGCLTLKVTVEDTGIGISTDEMDRLFKPFSQVDGSTSRRYGGTGLGLVIVKRLVEMMDGKVTASSTPGKGSRFTAFIRLGRAQSRKTSSLRVDRLSGLKAIVLESGDRAGRALESSLNALNIVCERASSLEDAIRSVAVGGSADILDIFLIDEAQFRCNGPELFARLEGLPRLSGAMFVVLYDFNSFQQAGEMARRLLGLQKQSLVFLEKPVTPIKLIKALVQDERKGPEEGAGEKTAKLVKRGKEELQGHGFDLMNQTVLVVDDDSLNREIVTAFLEKQAVTVREADNGDTAVEMIAKEPFDMVFMDVEMPVTDGYEATRRIRRLASPWAKNLPIVALTGHAFTEFRDKSFEAGMNDHMEKPVKPERIREMVQKWLAGPKKGQKAEREKPGFLSAKSSSAEDQVRSKRQFPKTKEKEETPSVNVQEGLSYVNHNWRIYEKLLNKFVEAYSDTGDHLFESVESANFTEAVHQLHKIKSIAAMIGAGELSSKAGELEGLFKCLENRKPLETSRADFSEDSDPFLNVRQKTGSFLEMLKNVLAESHRLIDTFETDSARDERKRTEEGGDPAHSVPSLGSESAKTQAKRR